MFQLITNKPMNVHFHENNGPTFDNLPSFEGVIPKTSNYYEMRTVGLFSGSYYVTGSANAQSIANGHNKVTDLEVYLVKDGPAEPWRKPPLWDSETLDSLKEFIRSFQPKEEWNVPEVNILLVGQVGAGKIKCRQHNQLRVERRDLYQILGWKFRAQSNNEFY